MTHSELYDLALKARENAYSPYSGVKVGAALLCADGRIFTGVNVENASYGATICAERSAACAAVTAGERQFAAIAVSGTMARETPCGICRQFLMEFSPTMDVVWRDPDGGLVVKRLNEILPEACAL